MSIDRIQLSAQLCQNLFPNSLIGEAAIRDSNKPLDKAKISSLGGNKRNIVLVINNKQARFLDDQQMEFLSNLLSACKLSMEDISLINYDQNKEVKYEEIIDQFQSQKILIFGVDASELGLPFTIPHFQIQIFNNQTFLLNPALGKILNDISLKKQLWICLKKLFNLN
ncbi:MAG: hypothetical protein ABIW47_14170 [Ginsengibacter sp.]